MSEMNFTQAADEVRKILRGFKAVEQVSAVLENLGSVENAAKEAYAQLEKTRAEVAAANEALNATKQAAALVTAEAQATLTKAKEEAKTVVKTAHDRATKAMAVSRTDLDKVAELVEERKGQLAALDESIKARTQEAVAAEAKLAKIREQIAKLVEA